MSRITVSEVREIITTNVGGESIIAFISAATNMITDVVGGEGLSDATLKELERWLTAHMIASTNERAAKEEGAGGAYIKYAGDWGAGLRSTSYGQMVLAMDPSRKFEELADGKKLASVYAVKSFD